MSDIAYHYQADQNPTEAEQAEGMQPQFINGVPLRDLTAGDVVDWPQHLHNSVAASMLYKPAKGYPPKPKPEPATDAATAESSPDSSASRTTSRKAKADVTEE